MPKAKCLPDPDRIRMTDKIHSGRAAQPRARHSGRFVLLLGFAVFGLLWFLYIPWRDIYMPPNGYNDTHYCTREMDRLQTNALSAYDVATRRRSYFGIESLLARDNPVIILWWQRQQEPISVEFKGFAPNPTVESWNAWQWRT